MTQGLTKISKTRVHSSVDPIGTSRANAPNRCGRALVVCGASKTSENWVSAVYLCIIFIWLVVVSIWVFVAWGADRQLNDSSRWRSLFALLISGVFAYPLIAIIALYSIAMNHTTLATQFVPISQ